jgi:hypothetical protein
MNDDSALLAVNGAHTKCGTKVSSALRRRTDDVLGVTL